MSKTEQKEFINSVLLNQDTYKSRSKAYLSAIQQNNKETVNFIISLASTILSNKKKYDPMVFLNMLRFIKEAFDQFNEEFIQKVQSTLLPTYTELGKFRMKDSDDTRGRFLFSEKPDKQLEVIGNSCLRLILECIMVWPTLYTVDSKKNPNKFKSLYENLLNAGVKFPSELNYYKKKPKNPNTNAVDAVKQNSQGLQSSELQKPQIGNMMGNANNQLKEIQEKIEENKNYKDLLVNILSVNKEEEIEQDNLTLIVDYFKQYIRQTENYLNFLLADGNQDKLLANVFMDQEFATDFTQDLKSFRSKSMPFSNFKQKYLTLIMKENQTPTPNQENPVNNTEPNKNERNIDNDPDVKQQKAENFHENHNEHAILRPNYNEYHEEVPENPMKNDDDSPILEKNQQFSAELRENDENQQDFNENPRDFNENPRDFEEMPPQKRDSFENIAENIEKPVFEDPDPMKSSHKSHKSSHKPANSLKNSVRSEKNVEKVVPQKNFRSEFVEKPANPYNFRSVVVRKDEAPKASFQKLFEISENYCVEPRKPVISKVIPRNEEKLSQILSKVKDLDRLSETSEKQSSEIFDYQEVRRENQHLKSENTDLRRKLEGLLSSQQENAEILAMLRQENQLLQERRSERLEIEEVRPKSLENEEKIMEKLQVNNEELRAENQALSEFIQQQIRENERLKQNLLNNEGKRAPVNEDFEMVEMLKKENEALRNYLLELQQKDAGNGQENAGVFVNNFVNSAGKHANVNVHSHLSEENKENEAFERLVQENEHLKGQVNDLGSWRGEKTGKSHVGEPDLRGSALSRETFELEEPNVQHNLLGVTSYKTKMMPTSNNRGILNKNLNSANNNAVINSNSSGNHNNNNINNNINSNNIVMSSNYNDDFKNNTNNTNKKVVVSHNFDQNDKIYNEFDHFESKHQASNSNNINNIQDHFENNLNISNHNSNLPSATKGKTSHWVHSSNQNPEEPEERKQNPMKNTSQNNVSLTSPHKKIFANVNQPANTEDLKRSVEVSGEKKKKNSEYSNNQSMEDSQHPRLSNYLKNSGGRFSRNESQKSVHNTDNNRSFEDHRENDQRLLPNFMQSQKPFVKNAMPYEGPRNFEENFDTNSILNNSVISVSQANLRFEESPYQSDLIYPFQRPSDYYQGKKAAKNIKGFLIQSEKGGLFDDLERNLKENSFRFKLACLRSKALLFDNNTMQIGLISGIYLHNEKNLLKMTLYFGNLTKYEISDFKVMYSGNSVISLWTKPEVLPEQITPKSQSKQDLLIDFNNIPYPFITIRGSYSFQDNNLKFLIPIPMTLNKFLQGKPIDSASFKYKWKEEHANSNIFKSETFDLHPRLAKSVYDFKKYFANLIDLNPHKEYDYVSGVEDYKLCGLFEMGQGVEILLKIVTQPNKKALFQVICKNNEVAEFLIRCLIFVFKK